MKRLSLYALYCEKGIVLEYVISYLKHLLSISDKVIVVVNGAIEECEKNKIAAIGCQVLQRRKNDGFDFAMWKYGIESVGWNCIHTYDELILCNSSCYCRKNGFKESFDKMAANKCDFWGMTEHKENKDILNPYERGGFLIKHLQSYFIVFRSGLTNDECFKKFWNELTPANEWQKVVWQQEVGLTAYFEKKGFTYDVCWPADSGKYNPTFFNILELFEKGIPLIKRKLFNAEPEILQMYGRDNAAEVMRCLNAKDSETEEVIWEDLLFNNKLSRLDKSLHLTRVISESNNEYCECDSKLSLAVIVFGYYVDQVNKICESLNNLPDRAEFFIVSSKKSVLESYRKALNGKKVHIRLCINRGRDLGALLTTCRDIFEKYELVCLAKDKKSLHAESIYSIEFSKHCFDCLYKTEIYCNNVLTLFEKNPRLGLVEPLIFDRLYFSVLNNKMGKNEQLMREIYKELKISIPFDDSPLAPFGSMFYVRSAAMRTLFNKNWELKQFPEEPLSPDGTILHAIERSFPMCAQNDGFYTLRIAPSNIFSSYMNTFEIRNEYKPDNIFKILKYWVLSKINFKKSKRKYYKNKLKYILN